MDNFWSNLFELAVNVFQGFIFMYFCYKFLGGRFDKKKNRICLLSFSLAEILVMTLQNYYFVVFNGVEVVFLILIPMLYTFTCLNGKVMAKVFVPVFSYCGNYGISAAVGFLVSSFSGVSMFDLMSVSSVYRLFCVLLVNIVYVLFLFMVLRFRDYKFDVLKWTDWVAFIVIPIVSIIVLVLTYTISLETNLTREHSLYLGLVAIGIIIVAVMIWTMLIKISKDSEFKLQYMLLQQQYKYQNENIMQADKSMKNISALRHDMKNKLLCIGELIKNGETEKALEMCGACSVEIKQSSGTFVKTRNVMLNSIINVKLSRATDSFIDTKVFITESFEDVADTDLCIMLGNILDNALEAVTKLPENNRKITITMERKGGYRYIVVKNSVEESILQKNPKLVTTKSDKSIHGIGIKSVQQTVKKYKGEIQYNEKDKMFCVGIIFPIPNLPK